MTINIKSTFSVQQRAAKLDSVNRQHFLDKLHVVARVVERSVATLQRSSSFVITYPKDEREEWPWAEALNGLAVAMMADDPDTAYVISLGAGADDHEDRQDPERAEDYHSIWCYLSRNMTEAL